MDSTPRPLAAALASRARLVGAAVGSGMAAAAAEEGGADFVLVLSAGYFRLQGVGSAAAFMPYASANELTWRIAREHVLPRLERTPVFVGVAAQDPSLDIDEHLVRIKDAGAAGIASYPTLALLDGPNRRLLEDDGARFEDEIALLTRARKRGLLTFAYAMTTDDVAALARAEVDILCLSLGTAEWRSLEGPQHQAALDDAIARVHRLATAARRIRPEAACVVSGGPLLTPADTALVYQRTEARGYVGGSAIDRFPAAPAIAQTVREFRNVATGAQQVHRLGAMVGVSPAMQQLFASIGAIAASDATVLLIGESGTGKEMVAREIHRLSHLAGRPLVSWNCGATSEGLAMSELFGHEKGAFTGATRTHVGKFELANGGTLFMDEVTDLPLSVQAALLRVLQQREIVRVGGERTMLVDVRVIAASNKEFTDLVPAGRFRLDLYYRLSTVILRVPPLRERREDIPHLVRELGEELSQKYGRPAPRLPDALMGVLLRHPWPGNIRELRNAVERLFLLKPGGGLSRAWLEDMLAADRALGERLSPSVPPSSASLDDKRARLADILISVGGNKTAAARALGVTRKTIHKWLRERL